MDDFLLITCKTKKYQSFLYTFTGLVITLILVALWEQFGFMWWIPCVMLVNFYILYTSAVNLFRGGRKISLLVSNNILYVNFRSGGFFKKHGTQIRSGELPGEQYDLKDISRLWIKKVTLNHSLVANNIKIMYRNKEVILFDLEAKSVQLTDEDIEKIAGFFVQHVPGITLGAA